MLNQNTIFLNVLKRNISVTKQVSEKKLNSAMYVFDRNTKLLQKQRAAEAPDVGIYDYIKDEVGNRLSDRIFDVKRKFHRALDLGCGRGHVSKYISKNSVQELVLADYCQSYLEQAETLEGIKIEKKILNEEEFELEANSLDFVISCLNLHWVNDLPSCFKCIMHCLKNDGLFMAAMFGSDTLYEMRGSLQLAELEREGGIASHISPFTEVRDVGHLLTQAGFTMLTIDTDEIVVGFPSMFDLMWDLKGMGENNASINRSLCLKRDTLFAASAVYDQLYGRIKNEEGCTYIPATFQIIYMTGWKPDESQPKPIARGSGKISMKNISNIDEIVKSIK